MVQTTLHGQLQKGCDTESKIHFFLKSLFQLKNNNNNTPLSPLSPFKMLIFKLTCQVEMGTICLREGEGEGGEGCGCADLMTRRVVRLLTVSLSSVFLQLLVAPNSAYVLWIDSRHLCHMWARDINGHFI